MPSNGCGLFGTLSKVHTWACGEPPVYEACCNEHDLAYEQAEDETDREWADKQFLRCMKGRGYPVWGHIFFVAVRYGGWLTWPKRWIMGLFD